jgi:hypothetical protein
MIGSSPFLKSSSSFLRFLPRLPVTSIPPFIFYMFLYVKKKVCLHVRVNSAPFPLDIQYNCVVSKNCCIILQYQNRLTEFSGSRKCTCRNRQTDMSKSIDAFLKLSSEPKQLISAHRFSFFATEVKSLAMPTDV